MRRVTEHDIVRYRREKVNRLKGFRYAPQRLASNDIFDLEELKDYHTNGDGYIRNVVRSTTSSTKNRLALKVDANTTMKKRLGLKVR